MEPNLALKNDLGSWLELLNHKRRNQQQNKRSKAIILQINATKMEILVAQNKNQATWLPREGSLIFCKMLSSIKIAKSFEFHLQRITISTRNLSDHVVQKSSQSTFYSSTATTRVICFHNFVLHFTPISVSFLPQLNCRRHFRVMWVTF